MFDDLKPHIADLRKALSISVASIFVMFFICFSFNTIILDFIIQPLVASLPKGSTVIFTKVQEPFFTAIKVSFFSGFLLSLPIIFWQIWTFIAPALYANEKKFVLPFVLFATTMFILGAGFSYYVVVPIGLKFLINFGSALFSALPSIGDYVGFFTKLVFGFGIAFELPVITLFLAKIGLINGQILRDFFKFAVVIIFVLSAILTPPDMVTQFLMAVPMVILYGFSILIADYVSKSTNEEDINENDEDKNNNEEQEKEDIK
jgi:sec-independent protein translocase protein TatC